MALFSRRFLDQYLKRGAARRALRVLPTPEGRSRPSKREPCDDGTLFLYGAAVLLDSGALTPDSGTLTLDSSLSLGGGMSILSGGMLMLDDHTMLPGPTDATLFGGGVPTDLRTPRSDALPEERRAIEGCEDVDERVSRAA